MKSKTTVVNIATVLTIAALLVIAPSGIGDGDDSLPGDYSYFGEIQTYELWAGQTTDVGEIRVSNNGDTLYVEYVIDEDGWYLVETHVHVGDDLSDIPQKNGNPRPGKFDEKTEHAGQPTYYAYWFDLDDIDAECDEDIYIATHAVVEKVQSEAPYGPCDAADDYATTQGLKKNGNPVDADRSDPENAFELDSYFYSLGFGGELTVEYCCPITNGPGDDITIWEETWGSYPVERAEVSVSQYGLSWTYLGDATNEDNLGSENQHASSFDLGTLTWANQLKIVDISDVSLHGGTADAFDVNAIYALHDCIQEETAWGDDNDFPGKNWAKYIKYTIVCPPKDPVFSPTATVSVSAVWPSGDCYWEVTFTTLEYDTAYLEVGMTLLGWCFEKDDQMSGGSKDVNLFSTYGYDIPDDDDWDTLEWDRINWIINNKGSYSTTEIQNAIWYILGEGGTNNQLAQDAAAYGDGFHPSAGQMMAIIIDTYQGIFFEIDP